MEKLIKPPKSTTPIANRTSGEARKLRFEAGVFFEEVGGLKFVDFFSSIIFIDDDVRAQVPWEKERGFSAGQA